MSDVKSTNTSDRLAEKIAEIDELISQARDDADTAAQLIAQLKMRGSIRKVKELEALKKQLQAIQTEAVNEETEDTQ